MKTHTHFCSSVKNTPSNIDLYTVKNYWGRKVEEKMKLYINNQLLCTDYYLFIKY